MVGSLTFYFLRNTEVSGLSSFYTRNKYQTGHTYAQEMSAILVTPVKVRHPAWSVVMKRMMDGSGYKEKTLNE